MYWLDCVLESTLMAEQAVCVLLVGVPMSHRRLLWTGGMSILARTVWTMIGYQSSLVYVLLALRVSVHHNGWESCLRPACPCADVGAPMSHR